MSYKTQAVLARDEGLISRVTACAATQGIPNPAGWAYNQQWALSSQPGWDAAYASALAADTSQPGADESVITDPMILSAVQAIAAEAAHA